MRDLYFGNVSPWELPPSHTVEYREISCKIESEEQYFTSKMSEDDYQRFEDYKTLLWQLNSMDDIDIFSHGFKLGTLLMMEMFSDEIGSPYNES